MKQGNRPQTTHWASILALVLWYCVAPLASAAEARPEHEVKAAFLVKFAAFVEWPAGAFAETNSPVVIGLLGSDPFGTQFEKNLQAQTLGGRRFLLRRCLKVADADGCHVLFISASERRRLGEIFPVLAQKPVLTVGDNEGFAARGGAINFIKEAGALRFEINVDAAARAQLKLNPKLLQLARIIRDPKP